MLSGGILCSWADGHQWSVKLIGAKRLWFVSCKVLVPAQRWARDSRSKTLELDRDKLTSPWNLQHSVSPRC